MHQLIEILNCDAQWGIGKKNGLLFHLPLDMKFFRETTSGHVVALGENTLLSFPHGQPLKNRRHIVLSGDPSHNYENVENVHSLEEFLSAIAKHLASEDVYVIGGASIYRQLLPYAHKVLLTKVQEDGGAEVFFENLDAKENWHCVKEEKPQIDEGHTIVFSIYENENPLPLL